MWKLLVRQGNKQEVMKIVSVCANSELHIRRGIEDNSKIFFLNFYLLEENKA